MDTSTTLASSGEEENSMAWQPPDDWQVPPAPHFLMDVKEPVVLTNAQKFAQHLQPFVPLASSEYRGTAIVLTAFSLAVTTALLLLLRLCLTRRSKGWLFSFESLAAAASVGLSIATYILYMKASQPGLAGLGLHLFTFPREDHTTTFEFVYAAQLVGVLALWASRLAAVALHHRLGAAVRPDRLSLAVTISIWMGSVFTLICVPLVVLECPDWSWIFMGPACTGSGSRQSAVVAMGILIDTWLALAPAKTVSRLEEFPANRRTRIKIAFALRIIIPFVALGQLHAIAKVQHTGDKSFEAGVQALWEMAVIFLSYFCSMLLRMLPFWRDIDFHDSTPIPTAMELKVNPATGRKRTGSEVRPFLQRSRSVPTTVGRIAKIDEDSPVESSQP